jgi:hypothetical protein
MSKLKKVNECLHARMLKGRHGPTAIAQAKALQTVITAIESMSYELRIHAGTDPHYRTAADAVFNTNTVRRRITAIRRLVRVYEERRRVWEFNVALGVEVQKTYYDAEYYTVTGRFIVQHKAGDPITGKLKEVTGP